MERWQNKVAVVTGASSGIGAQVAKDLVKNGMQVVGLARRVERIEDLKKELPVNQRDNLFALKCDVSNVKSVNDAFDTIIAKYGGVDILVNNAGCLKPGQMTTMDVTDMERVLQTNVMGVVYCTQRAFKSMNDRNSAGHVILINSIAGHAPGHMCGAPNVNIYSPSKFAVTCMTEVYREEFKDLNSNVKITSISPGAVDTEITPPHMKDIHAKVQPLKSADISSAVLYVISTPPHVQVHEMIIKPMGCI